MRVTLRVQRVVSLEKNSCLWVEMRHLIQTSYSLSTKVLFIISKMASCAASHTASTTRVNNCSIHG